MLNYKKLLLPTALTALVSSFSAQATLINGIDFPDGEVSFADAVVSYSPDAGGSAQPTPAYQGAENALGLPDYDGQNFCSDTEDCSFVSLGDGGSIVLRFINNVLTGSDNSDDDLWIFEIGPDVEDTFVEISVDGSTWFSVGSVGGSTSGVDIDAYGFTTADSFSYVRLTDDTSEGQQSGDTVGADIDAVGAISTRVVPTPVNAPSMILLVLSGLLVSLRRRINAK